MFGRLSYIEGDPDRIDDLIIYAKTVVKPAIDQLPGSAGLGMWVNRMTGGCLVVSAWTDETTLFESEIAVIKLRDDAAGIIGGSSLVERYELAYIDMAEPNQPGYITNQLRLHCDPSLLDENLAWAKDNIVPALRSVIGYTSYAMMCDRHTGAIIAMSTFCDERAAKSGYAATEFARESATSRGTMILGVREYEVALVGIRNTTSLPHQRTLDLSETAQPLIT